MLNKNKQLPAGTEIGNRMLHGKSHSLLESGCARGSRCSNRTKKRGTMMTRTAVEYEVKLGSLRYVATHEIPVESQHDLGCTKCSRLAAQKQARAGRRGDEDGGQSHQSENTQEVSNR